MLEELKSGKKTVGIKQSLKALKAGNVKVAFIARDADERFVANVKEACQAGSVEVVYVDSMKQLGKACGIDVGAAVACLLK